MGRHDVDGVLDADSEVFLEVVEGGWAELAAVRHSEGLVWFLRVVLLLLGGGGLDLENRLHWLFLFWFGEELIHKMLESPFLR